MLSNAKYRYLQEREAKPDQERNEINGRGPPPAGRMPFMSDSTLSRRSAALRRQDPPNKLPTEDSEEPQLFTTLFIHSSKFIGSFSDPRLKALCVSF